MPQPDQTGPASPDPGRPAGRPAPSYGPPGSAEYYGPPGSADAYSPPLPPGPPTPPSGSGSRLSRRTIVIFAGLAAAGLVAGIAAAKVTGDDSQTSALRPGQIVATSPAATPMVTTPAPSIAVTTATPTPSPSRTKYVPPDYSVIPIDATTAKDLDFGFLTGVQKNGDLITLSFDRALFYTGKEAIRKNSGKAPDNDYLIENTNPMIRTFTLSPKAPIMGTSRLLPGSTGSISQQRLTPQAFVQNATAALASGLGIPVWVRHTQGENGPITSLAEQFVP